MATRRLALALTAAAFLAALPAQGAIAQRAAPAGGQQPVDLAPESRPAVPMPGETRLVSFTYDPNDTYTILTMPGTVTHVELRKSERVLALALGDGTQWQAQKRDNNLFIRPVREGLYTSATLVTNERTYQLSLRSSPYGGKWYQRVSWQYPDVIVLEENQAELERAIAATRPREAEPPRAKPASAALAVDKLNFSYDVAGEARFRPEQVFDDGTFTYLRFAKRPQELPAVFVKNRDGGFGLAAYSLEPETPTLKVHRLFEVAVLKLGEEEVTITNRNGASR